MKRNPVRQLSAAVVFMLPLLSHAVTWQASLVEQHAAVNTATDCRTNCTPDQQEARQDTAPAGTFGAQVNALSQSGDANYPAPYPSKYSATSSGQSDIVFNVNDPFNQGDTQNTIQVRSGIYNGYAGDWAAHDPVDVAAHIAPASATGDGSASLTFKVDEAFQAMLRGSALNGSASLYKLGSGGSADELIASVTAGASYVDLPVQSVTLLPGLYRIATATALNVSWFDVPAFPYTVDKSISGSAMLNISSPVPEPSTFALMGLGVLGLLMVRKQKRIG